MIRLSLDPFDKNEVQKVMELMEGSDPRDVNQFLEQLPSGNIGAVQRFLQGAYNHPVTWWIGVFQLQMQMGLWGPRRRAVASVRANTLWQVSRPLRDEALGALKGGDAPILAAVVRYNLRFRKADVLGRFAGGQFTNYASTGGRFGERRLGHLGKGVRLLTNLTLASYGAAIKAIVKGHRDVEAIIQSVLTGQPQDLPSGYRNISVAPTAEEEAVLLTLQAVLNDVVALSQLAPAPVPLQEFCSRPQNINLQGVCR